ncbi:class Ib ribonucleoside-diphosphate reductase assembly flavoprotein NrdI [Oceanivirga miroungae]|uniref:Protein NrdI n=1 Tax=Oceanivirga miroungae TaxID=1130046 RepID=A0A6I8M6X4_9FUSO|nr:class Ib ribonucleoside-diphosphate reductase assembly flavoprotein NrdI [Oceanivirga miroungae]VWL85237.1 NrdI protein [Oceanivirga miroungae]
MDKKPKAEINIVYFSSKSNNTHRFIEKLKFKNVKRIPVDLNEKLSVTENYVLIIPTYSGGNGDTKGAVVKQVIQFLNDENNRKKCCGVIASGNTNFGDTYCLAGLIISKKLNIPLLYQFELLGNSSDVKNVENILEKLWEK